MLIESCGYAKRLSATPIYSLHDPWRVFIFVFMTGKSSWVHSRTQGSIPMLFCRWSNVLWLLHPLPVPRYGRWLDQGRWSLRLFFCFCGNDQNYGTVSDLVCVLYFRTKMLPLLVNLVCNNFKHSDVFGECFRTGCIYECWPLNLLRSWLYVRYMWFEILWDFTDYQDYMGLSWMVWLCEWSLSGLISYNLGGSVTAGIGARFSELLFMSTF